MALNEKELLISLKQGDKDAFTTIYKLYSAKVYNFTRLYFTSTNSAEDVVQEVFIKLWDVRSFINENENFKGFLFIITRNIIFNQSRRKFNESFYQMSVLTALEESYDIETELDAKDLKSYIDLLVSELPPRQQEVYRLSRENFLSYKEISLKLDIKEKTVERHINEALKYLKKNIQLFLLFSVI